MGRKKAAAIVVVAGLFAIVSAAPALQKSDSSRRWLKRHEEANERPPSLVSTVESTYILEDVLKPIPGTVEKSIVSTTVPVDNIAVSIAVNSARTSFGIDPSSPSSFLAEISVVQTVTASSPESSEALIIPIQEVTAVQFTAVAAEVAEPIKFSSAELNHGAVKGYASGEIVTTAIPVTPVLATWHEDYDPSPSEVSHAFSEPTVLETNIPEATPQTIRDPTLKDNEEDLTDDFLLGNGLVFTDEYGPNGEDPPYHSPGFTVRYADRWTRFGFANHGEWVVSLGHTASEAIVLETEKAESTPQSTRDPTLKDNEEDLTDDFLLGNGLVFIDEYGPNGEDPPYHSPGFMVRYADRWTKFGFANHEEWLLSLGYGTAIRTETVPLETPSEPTSELKGSDIVKDGEEDFSDDHLVGENSGIFLHDYGPNREKPPYDSASPKIRYADRWTEFGFADYNAWVISLTSPFDATQNNEKVEGIHTEVSPTFTSEAMLYGEDKADEEDDTCSHPDELGPSGEMPPYKGKNIPCAERWTAFGYSDWEAWLRSLGYPTSGSTLDQDNELRDCNHSDELGPNGEYPPYTMEEVPCAERWTRYGFADYDDWLAFLTEDTLDSSVKGNTIFPTTLTSFTGNAKPASKTNLFPPPTASKRLSKTIVQTSPNSASISIQLSATPESVTGVVYPTTDAGGTYVGDVDSEYPDWWWDVPAWLRKLQKEDGPLGEYDLDALTDEQKEFWENDRRIIKPVSDISLSSTQTPYTSRSLSSSLLNIPASAPSRTSSRSPRTSVFPHSLKSGSIFTRVPTQSIIHASGGVPTFTSTPSPKLDPHLSTKFSEPMTYEVDYGTDYGIDYETDYGTDFDSDMEADVALSEPDGYRYDSEEDYPYGSDDGYFSEAEAENYNSDIEYINKTAYYTVDNDPTFFDAEDEVTFYEAEIGTAYSSDTSYYGYDNELNNHDSDIEYSNHTVSYDSDDGYDSDTEHRSDGYTAEKDPYRKTCCTSQSNASNCTGCDQQISSSHEDESYETFNNKTLGHGIFDYEDWPAELEDSAGHTFESVEEQACVNGTEDGNSMLPCNKESTGWEYPAILDQENIFRQTEKSSEPYTYRSPNNSEGGYVTVDNPAAKLNGHSESVKRKPSYQTPPNVNRLPPYPANATSEGTRRVYLNEKRPSYTDALDEKSPHGYGSILPVQSSHPSSEKSFRQNETQGAKRPSWFNVTPLSRSKPTQSPDAETFPSGRNYSELDAASNDNNDKSHDLYSSGIEKDVHSNDAHNMENTSYSTPSWFNVRPLSRSKPTAAPAVQLHNENGTYGPALDSSYYQQEKVHSNNVIYQQPLYKNDSLSSPPSRPAWFSVTPLSLKATPGPLQDNTEDSGRQYEAELQGPSVKNTQSNKHSKVSYIDKNGIPYDNYKPGDENAFQYDEFGNATDSHGTVYPRPSTEEKGGKRNTHASDDKFADVPQEENFEPHYRFDEYGNAIDQYGFVFSNPAYDPEGISYDQYGNAYEAFDEHGNTYKHQSPEEGMWAGGEHTTTNSRPTLAQFQVHSDENGAIANLSEGNGSSASDIAPNNVRQPIYGASSGPAPYIEYYDDSQDGFYEQDTSGYYQYDDEGNAFDAYGNVFTAPVADEHGRVFIFDNHGNVFDLHGNSYDAEGRSYDPSGALLENEYSRSEGNDALPPRPNTAPGPTTIVTARLSKPVEAANAVPNRIFTNSSFGEGLFENEDDARGGRSATQELVEKIFLGQPKSEPPVTRYSGRKHGYGFSIPKPQVQHQNPSGNPYPSPYLDSYPYHDPRLFGNTNEDPYYIPHDTVDGYQYGYGYLPFGFPAYVEGSTPYGPYYGVAECDEFDCYAFDHFGRPIVIVIENINKINNTNNNVNTNLVKNVIDDANKNNANSDVINNFYDNRVINNDNRQIHNYGPVFINKKQYKTLIHEPGPMVPVKSSTVTVDRDCDCYTTMACENCPIETSYVPPLRTVTVVNPKPAVVEATPTAEPQGDILDIGVPCEEHPCLRRHQQPVVVKPCETCSPVAEIIEIIETITAPTPVQYATITGETKVATFTPPPITKTVIPCATCIVETTEITQKPIITTMTRLPAIIPITELTTLNASLSTIIIELPPTTVLETPSPNTVTITPCPTCEYITSTIQLLPYVTTHYPKPVTMAKPLPNFSIITPAPIIVTSTPSAQTVTVTPCPTCEYHTETIQMPAVTFTRTLEPITLSEGMTLTQIEQPKTQYITQSVTVLTVTPPPQVSILTPCPTCEYVTETITLPPYVMTTQGPKITLARPLPVYSIVTQPAIVMTETPAAIFQTVTQRPYVEVLTENVQLQPQYITEINPTTVRSPVYVTMDEEAKTVLISLPPVVITETPAPRTTVFTPCSSCEYVTETIHLPPYVVTSQPPVVTVAKELAYEYVQKSAFVITRTPDAVTSLVQLSPVTVVETEISANAPVVLTKTTAPVVVPFSTHVTKAEQLGTTIITLPPVTVTKQPQPIVKTIKPCPTCVYEESTIYLSPYTVTKPASVVTSVFLSQPPTTQVDYAEPVTVTRILEPITYVHQLPDVDEFFTEVVQPEPYITIVTHEIKTAEVTMSILQTLAPKTIVNTLPAQVVVETPAPVVNTIQPCPTCVYLTSTVELSPITVTHPARVITSIIAENAITYSTIEQAPVVITSTLTPVTRIFTLDNEDLSTEVFIPEPVVVTSVLPAIAVPIYTQIISELSDPPMVMTLPGTTLTQTPVAAVKTIHACPTCIFETTTIGLPAYTVAHQAQIITTSHAINLGNEIFTPETLNPGSGAIARTHPNVSIPAFNHIIPTQLPETVVFTIPEQLVIETPAPLVSTITLPESGAEKTVVIPLPAITITRSEQTFTTTIAQPNDVILIEQTPIIEALAKEPLVYTSTHEPSTSTTVLPGGEIRTTVVTPAPLLVTEKSRESFTWETISDFYWPTDLPFIPLKRIPYAGFSNSVTFTVPEVVKTVSAQVPTAPASTVVAAPVVEVEEPSAATVPARTSTQPQHVETIPASIEIISRSFSTMLSAVPSQQINSIMTSITHQITANSQVPVALTQSPVLITMSPITSTIAAQTVLQPEKVFTIMPTVAGQQPIVETFAAETITIPARVEIIPASVTTIMVADYKSILQPIDNYIPQGPDGAAPRFTAYSQTTPALLYGFDHPPTIGPLPETLSPQELIGILPPSSNVTADIRNQPDTAVGRPNYMQAVKIVPETVDAPVESIPPTTGNGFAVIENIASEHFAEKSIRPPLLVQTPTAQMPSAYAFQFNDQVNLPVAVAVATIPARIQALSAVGGGMSDGIVTVPEALITVTTQVALSGTKISSPMTITMAPRFETITSPSVDGPDAVVSVALPKYTVTIPVERVSIETILVSQAGGQTLRAISTTQALLDEYNIHVQPAVVKVPERIFTAQAAPSAPATVKTIPPTIVTAAVAREQLQQVYGDEARPIVVTVPAFTTTLQDNSPEIPAIVETIPPTILTVTEYVIPERTPVVLNPAPLAQQIQPTMQPTYGFVPRVAAAVPQVQPVIITVPERTITIHPGSTNERAIVQTIPATVATVTVAAEEVRRATAGPVSEPLVVTVPASVMTSDSYNTLSTAQTIPATVLTMTEFSIPEQIAVNTAASQTSVSQLQSPMLDYVSTMVPPQDAQVIAVPVSVPERIITLQPSAYDTIEVVHTVPETIVTVTIQAAAEKTMQIDAMPPPLTVTIPASAITVQAYDSTPATTRIISETVLTITEYAIPQQTSFRTPKPTTHAQQPLSAQPAQLQPALDSIPMPNAIIMASQSLAVLLPERTAIVQAGLGVTALQILPPSVTTVTVAADKFYQAVSATMPIVVTVPATTASIQVYGDAQPVIQTIPAAVYTVTDYVPLSQQTSSSYPDDSPPAYVPLAAQPIVVTVPAATKTVLPPQGGDAIVRTIPAAAATVTEYAVNGHTGGPVVAVIPERVITVGPARINIPPELETIAATIITVSEYSMAQIASLNAAVMSPIATPSAQNLLSSIETGPELPIVFTVPAFFNTIAEVSGVDATVQSIREAVVTVTSHMIPQQSELPFIVTVPGRLGVITPVRANAPTMTALIPEVAVTVANLASVQEQADILASKQSVQQQEITYGINSSQRAPAVVAVSEMAIPVTTTFGTASVAEAITVPEVIMTRPADNDLHQQAIDKQIVVAQSQLPVVTVRIPPTAATVVEAVGATPAVVQVFPGTSVAVTVPANVVASQTPQAIAITVPIRVETVTPVFDSSSATIYTLPETTTTIVVSPRRTQDNMGDISAQQMQIQSHTRASEIAIPYELRAFTTTISSLVQYTTINGYVTPVTTPSTLTTYIAAAPAENILTEFDHAVRVSVPAQVITVQPTSGTVAAALYTVPESIITITPAMDVVVGDKATVIIPVVATSTVSATVRTLPPSGTRPAVVETVTSQVATLNTIVPALATVLPVPQIVASLPMVQGLSQFFDSEMSVGHRQQTQFPTAITTAVNVPIQQQGNSHVLSSQENVSVSYRESIYTLPQETDGDAVAYKNVQVPSVHSPSKDIVPVEIVTQTLQVPAQRPSQVHTQVEIAYPLYGAGPVIPSAVSQQRTASQRQSSIEATRPSQSIVPAQTATTHDILGGDRFNLTLFNSLLNSTYFNGTGNFTHNLNMTELGMNTFNTTSILSRLPPILRDRYLAYKNLHRRPAFTTVVLPVSATITPSTTYRPLLTTPIFEKIVELPTSPAISKSGIKSIGNRIVNIIRNAFGAEVNPATNAIADARLAARSIEEPLSATSVNASAVIGFNNKVVENIDLEEILEYLEDSKSARRAANSPAGRNKATGLPEYGTIQPIPTTLPAAVPGNNMTIKLYDNKEKSTHFISTAVNRSTQGKAVNITAVETMTPLPVSPTRFVLETSSARNTTAHVSTITDVYMSPQTVQSPKTDNGRLRQTRAGTSRLPTTTSTKRISQTHPSDAFVMHSSVSTIRTRAAVVDPTPPASSARTRTTYVNREGSAKAPTLPLSRTTHQPKERTTRQAHPSYVLFEGSAVTLRPTQAMALGAAGLGMLILAF